jgi:DNA-binding NarL/FixJ family response regulator
VRDLFFVARIRETGRLAGAQVGFARSPDEVAAALSETQADLVIVDLTAPALNPEAVLAAVARDAPGVAVLGYTTHVLARQTQPLHHRCTRVVTKDALTRELPRILTHGLAA